jgi:hypothetical protein
LVQAHAAKSKLNKRLSKTTEPLDYDTTLRIVRDGIQAVNPAPVVVAEGANTMDNARLAGLADFLILVEFMNSEVSVTGGGVGALRWQESA